jgi:CRP/FNR family cyclic AMP-dependent transcriptional regulator
VIVGTPDHRAVEEPSDHPAIAGRVVRWPLFRDLQDETFRAVTGLMRMDSHPSGRLLLLDGERYTNLFVLARGFASLNQMSLSGREHILGYLGPGRFLNLAAVLDSGPQSGSVKCVTPVDLYSIQAAAFLSVLSGHADLGIAVARALAQENRSLSEIARGLALDPVRKRLAAFLLEFAQHAPPQQRWTQDLIAAHIGTVRDVVGRILRDLTQDGLIARDRGQLVILDREGLEREAGTSDE